MAVRTESLRVQPYPDISLKAAQPVLVQASHSLHDAIRLPRALRSGNVNGAIAKHRIITEEGHPGKSFAMRHMIYGDDYTEQRASDALYAYQTHRLWSDAERQVLYQSVEDIEGHAFFPRRRQRKFNPESRGGEVVIVVPTAREAVERTRELVGPVYADQRDYTSARLGIHKDSHRQGEATPIQGFSAEVPRGRNGKLHRVEWRADYDPEKGAHFNVTVLPSRETGQGFKSCREAESLCIAIVYPGEESVHRQVSSLVEDTVIDSMDNPNPTAYLPVFEAK